ncbi:two-component system, NtrC family, sensor histidine kinase AtoS [Malonomonas rubra DSM 5091]|uniref:histidine kinase n=1 Tax=Malonomonas rubra DSM 5091 TaxID=1122189 RepID=A0A1M6HXU5_MALRU|nr:ATP-binding protein [Malonomonas rubra]SHJ27046.1 two-component system, NtrC family, sensor histidine kinase AtoS [Malonomonas rubra DSM 5091]
MKKQVLIALSLMIICFVTGGIYIAVSFQVGTEKLERITALHQVEFMRQSLEHDIKVAQSSLLLQGSPHNDIESTISHIEEIERAANNCLTCHHDPATKQKLEEMLLDLNEYMQLYSRTLTIRANQVRLQQARTLTYEKGEQLLTDVKSLSIASAGKISSRIQDIHQDIRTTNKFLILCLVLGPIAILLISLFFLRRFTGSVTTLTKATEHICSGNLEPIDIPLKNEFKALAGSFNKMVDSLKQERVNVSTANALYLALFEAAGDGICILHTGEKLGQIASVNPATLQLYGYTAEELIGKNCMDLSPAEEHAKFQEKMQKIMQGEWINCTITRIRKNGEHFAADISAGPLEINQQQYVLTFTRDVTERQKAQQELQRTNQMAIVGQMAAGLAHEIKNPLAGVKVSLDVLSEDVDLDAEDKEIFVRVLKEIDRMEKLLKGLLNYARPPTPHFDLIDINRLLEHTIKNVSVTVGDDLRKKVEFKTDLATDMPQSEADSGQLQQVFLNIYLNAIDAMDGVGTITTTTQREDENYLRIEFSDTGKGLSENMREQIFSPFFTTKSKGSGLGLAICRRLIEQHAGYIDVDSTEGTGTTFTIRLPLKQEQGE